MARCGGIVRLGGDLHCPFVLVVETKGYIGNALRRYRCVAIAASLLLRRCAHKTHCGSKLPAMAGIPREENLPLQGAVGERSGAMSAVEWSNPFAPAAKPIETPGQRLLLYILPLPWCPHQQWHMLGNGNNLSYIKKAPVQHRGFFIQINQIITFW